MVTVENKKQNDTIVYKMTDEERLDITNQLNDAIKLNKDNPKKREWNSNNYRVKYGI